ncbi:hypothetical protein BKA67DRAFT_559579 [Truncatella angustata]|uniref:Secreted protein n=1 Tax=Truncatella angustata TaxID=152316 RepID=A0A9P8UMX2_9PEZI|nr:uncharacterized protein BKA67DRAFT_559579 [Truncatella angustata]KAH6655142.1 hypothetical protein BKA67DRAFT_559579 [Truncatella angustata]
MLAHSTWGVFALVLQKTTSLFKYVSWAHLSAPSEVNCTGRCFDSRSARGSAEPIENRQPVLDYFPKLVMLIQTLPGSSRMKMSIFT